MGLSRSSCGHASLFQISDFGFDVSGFRIQSSDFRFTISDFRLQFLVFVFQISDSRFYFEVLDSRFEIADVSTNTF